MPARQHDLSACMSPLQSIFNALDRIASDAKHFLLLKLRKLLNRLVGGLGVVESEYVVEDVVAALGGRHELENLTELQRVLLSINLSPCVRRGIS